MSSPSLPADCDHERRRALIRGAEEEKFPLVHGIDYVRVVEDQEVLEVHFIDKSSGHGTSSLKALLAAFANHPEKVSIEGGRRLPEVEVVDVEAVDVGNAGGYLRVEVNHRGDFSPYTLELEPPSDDDGAAAAEYTLDPPFATCEFGFKAACPSRFDCLPEERRRPEEGEAPAVDYMAKDYASFRRALLDLAPQLAPDWEERRAADLGITLVELLAHLGDELSYFQDAVANEAYLETARRRVSVRRHARLVDYTMHDGLSARSFLHLGVAALPDPQLVPPGTSVVSKIRTRLRDVSPPHGPELPHRLAEEAEEAAEVVFETDVHQERYRGLPLEGGETATGVPVDGRLNEIPIHAWGNEECVLPEGATSADLRGDLLHRSEVESSDDGVDRSAPWRLAKGDLLLLEEVRDPAKGTRPDADPAHRQVVRLTGAEMIHDPVADETVTRVRWHEEDALRFPLCVRTEGAEDRNTGPLGDFQAGVARGNLVPVHHGRTAERRHPERRGASTPEGIEVGERAYRIPLGEGPLSQRLPFDGETPVSDLRSLSRRDLDRAEPQVELREETEAEDGSRGCEGTPWTPVASLLDGSGPFDHHFVPETDADGRAVLRFGDGEYGRVPREGTRFCVRYRVGVGRQGNVGPGALRHLIVPEDGSDFWPEIEAVRNPVAAWGGVEPEPMEEVKEKAPEAFHARQFRAVTADDYRRMTERHPGVSNAVATFRWTGSWHTVFLSVDPAGQTEFGSEFEESVLEHVRQFRMAGYDLEIAEPDYVPLEIRLEICVSPGHFPADVREGVEEALGSGLRPDGTPAFFHPDRFGFGDPLYESELYAAVERVPGVESANLQRFGPLHREETGSLAAGVIEAGRTQILRLDDDPDFPEHGVLELDVRGGK